MIEVAFGVALAAALSTSGWALYRVARIDDLDRKLDYVIQRVDSLYDYLLNR